MDLLETLQLKIDSLPEGEYSLGLKAVLLHIRTAFRHLARGQGEGDDTAFTDAIYRTNQAFEGSIKEAYRVLASKDPDKVRPFDIETYLEKGNIFRPRVLSQFTNYRMEWRNPSTHDYKLDFDEGEAFLAIISVSAFACLLLDQISGYIAYLESNREAESKKAAISAVRRRVAKQTDDLMGQVVDLLKEYARMEISSGSKVPVSASQLLGSVSGFLASAYPDLSIESEVQLSSNHPDRADLLLSAGSSKVLLEVKRSYSPALITEGASKLKRLMELGGVKSGILFTYPEQGELRAVWVESPQGRVALVAAPYMAPNPVPAADV